MNRFRLWLLRWLLQDQRIPVDLWAAPREATRDYLISMNPQRGTPDAELVAQAPWAARSKICPLWDFERNRMATVEIYRRPSRDSDTADTVRVRRPIW